MRKRLALLLGLFAAQAQAETLRCGTQLVSVGDRVSTTLHLGSM